MTPLSIPNCPLCSSPMKQRTGIRGPFYGCSQYPKCKGTRQVPATSNPDQALLSEIGNWDSSTPPPPFKRPVKRTSGSPFAQAISQMGSGPSIAVVAFNKHIATEMESKLSNDVLLEGSDEQRAIWKEMLEGTSHIVVNAAAGTGKTFCIYQGIARLRQSVDARARACTYHSLGLSILRANFGNVKVNQGKLKEILDAIKIPKGHTDSSWKKTLSATEKLVRMCKNYMLDGLDKEQLEWLADRHTIEVPSDQSYALVSDVLQACQDRTYDCDYDDMIWMPPVWKISARSYDMLFVEESQDTSKPQQELAKLACPSGRIIIVGDPWQSLYSFRGADSNAMHSLAERLSKDARGCKSLPLTITRRCPQSHVRMASAISGPDVICAMDDAPEGIVRTVSARKAIAEMRPGDMVLCRVNKHLIPTCYALIRRGTKAVIRGKNIGEGLESLIQKLGAPEDIGDLMVQLEAWYSREMRRLLPLGDKAEGRRGAIQDRHDTLVELCEGMSSTSQVLARIQQIFADFDTDGQPLNAVVLGTAHQCKGLEANRVFILAPDLIPHPMAKQEHEVQGEACLAYVACTRAKYDHDKGLPGELIFVGGVPEIYGDDWQTPAIVNKFSDPMPTPPECDGYSCSKCAPSTCMYKDRSESDGDDMDNDNVEDDWPDSPLTEPDDAVNPEPFEPFEPSNDPEMQPW